MTHSDHRFVGTGHWDNAQPVPAGNFRCGYCSADVGSERGWKTSQTTAVIRLCPTCQAPTLFGPGDVQWPGVKAGQTVGDLPKDVESIHEEARSSIAGNAPTGAAMLCRKILMHVAVEKGAAKNKSFKEYVEWLVSEHWAPKGAEVWLNYIRTHANDANHEIMVMSKEDATAVLLFTEALLRNVYELPALVPDTTRPSEEPNGESG